jgi:large subunit ribosomal protein L6
MSRIGRKPIALPKGVEFNLEENNLVTVKGPKGTLTRQFDPEMNITLDNGTLTVTRPSESNRHRQLHGLTRTLLDNMVIGVSAGYRRNLEISGVGYRALKDGDMLVMLLGYSHSIRLEPPPGIKFGVDTPTRISVEGIDKELVGQEAARVREMRPPEPYKGKGVRYANEVIKRKAGKSGKAGKK